jgi:hypothetical protein
MKGPPLVGFLRLMASKNQGTVSIDTPPQDKELVSTAAESEK